MQAYRKLTKLSLFKTYHVWDLSKVLGAAHVFGDQRINDAEVRWLEGFMLLRGLRLAERGARH